MGLEKQLMIRMQLLDFELKKYFDKSEMEQYKSMNKMKSGSQSKCMTLKYLEKKIVGNLKFQRKLQFHVFGLRKNNSYFDLFRSDMIMYKYVPPQCELVHTFFHPLLRDEQEAEKVKPFRPKIGSKKFCQTEAIYASLTFTIVRL